MSECLDQETFDIVCYRYGIYDYRYKTLQQCSDHYGISRERIRQRISRAFRRLHHPKRVNRLRDLLEDVTCETHHTIHGPRRGFTIPPPNGQRWVSKRVPPHRARTRRTYRRRNPWNIPSPRLSQNWEPFPPQFQPHLFSSRSRLIQIKSGICLDPPIIEGEPCKNICWTWVRDGSMKYVLHVAWMMERMVARLLAQGFEKMGVGRYEKGLKIVRFFSYPFNISGYVWIATSGFKT